MVRYVIDHNYTVIISEKNLKINIPVKNMFKIIDFCHFVIYLTVAPVIENFLRSAQNYLKILFKNL